MSGTRSPSPRAPAIEALIVAHGQPSDPAPAEAQTARLAADVAVCLPGARVRGVTLAQPGALEQALATCAAPRLIYPLFMSDGWFTACALPKRLNGTAGRVLTPLGLDPALPALAARQIVQVTRAHGWSPAEMRLILAAHGSGHSGNPARAARDFAGRLAERLSLHEIRIGFVAQPPSITEAAVGAGTRAICLPFFAAAGGHVRDDVPRALAAAGFTGPTLAPIGLSPGIPSLIARALWHAMGPAVQGRGGSATHRDRATRQERRHG